MNVDDLLQPELAKLLALGCAELQKDYHGVGARLYDSIQGGGRDISFYLRTIAAGSATILELGSGTGRVAIPLAQAGHTVYALDNSIDMQQILRDKTPESLRANLLPVYADMCAFNLNTLFDFVILGLNTVFALVDEQSRRDCFRAVSRHLKPDGKFIVDFAVPTASLASNTAGKYSLSVHQESEKRAYIVLTYNRYDIKRQLSILNFFTLEVENSRISKAYVAPAAEYYPSPIELKLLTGGAGMKVEEILGDYEGHPLCETGTASDVIMIAGLGTTR